MLNPNWVISAIIWRDKIISIKGNGRHEKEKENREEGRKEKTQNRRRGKAGEVEVFEHFGFLAM